MRSIRRRALRGGRSRVALLQTQVNERLKLALRETEQARRQIARGKSGAAALALRTLARQLDAG